MLDGQTEGGLPLHALLATEKRSVQDVGCQKLPLLPVRTVWFGNHYFPLLEHPAGTNGHRVLCKPCCVGTVSSKEPLLSQPNPQVMVKAYLNLEEDRLCLNCQASS